MILRPAVIEVKPLVLLLLLVAADDPDLRNRQSQEVANDGGSERASAASDHQGRAGEIHFQSAASPIKHPRAALSFAVREYLLRARAFILRLNRSI